MAEERKCFIGKDYDNWCEEFPLENAGDEACCYFHSRQNYKHETGMLFNEYVLKYIEKCIDTQKKCDLRGITFKDRFILQNFKDGRSIGNINFSKCVFEKEFIIKNVSFKGSTLFQGTEFKGTLSIFDTSFFEDTDFNNSKFEKNDFEFFEISHSKFYKSVNFENIDFNNHMRIYNSKFAGTALFNGSNFYKINFFKEHVPNNTSFDSGVQFCEVNFFEEVDFSYLVINTGSFDNTVFKKKSKFRGTHFEDFLSFKNVVFEGDADFGSNRPYEEPGSRFVNCMGDFEQAEFNKNAFFNNSIGDGLNLEKAKFKGNVYFTRTNFKEMDCEKVEFSGNVSFAKSKIVNMANFQGSRFMNFVSFFETVFCCEVHFSECVFEDKVEFEKTEFNINENIKHSIVLFNETVFKKFIIFKNVNFEVSVDFSRCWFFEPVEFYSENEKGMFNDGLVFKSVNIRDIVKFENINLENALFADTQINKIDLISCDIAKDGEREIFYDEKLVLFEKDKKRKIKDLADTDYKTLIKVEVLNRLFKQKHNDNHNWVEVSKFHYNEKNIMRIRANYQRRNEKTWSERLSARFKFIGLSLYYFMSGYNEKFSNAFWVSVFLLLVTGGFAVGGICFNWHWLGEWLSKSISFIPLVGDKGTIKEATGFWKVGFMLVQILIVIQLGLLGMTVRNKLRR